MKPHARTYGHMHGQTDGQIQMDQLNWYERTSDGGNGNHSVSLLGLQQYSYLTIRYVSRYLPHDTIRIAIHF